MPNAIIDVQFPDFIAEVFTPHVTFVPWSVLDGSEAERSAVDAIVSFTHEHIGVAEVDRLPNVKVLSNYGAGVDHIDVEEIRTRNIPMGNTPGAVDGATADITFALILAVARNMVVADRFARGPDFLAFDPTILLGRDVFGATLGIIGMGRIGRAVARRAKAFDMTVLYHNRNRDEDTERTLGVRYAPMDELLGSADFVSVLTPLTAATRNLIGKRELALMRSDAFLINTARGGVVDTAALLEALRSGAIAGAGVDVTEPEPLPRDHPLLALENLTILPHIGTSTLQTRRRMGEMACQNLVAGLKGESLPWSL